MTTSQEAAAGRNAQTAQKVCYRFMIILCLNGTEGLLLLYTSRQNKRLYYLQMSGLKNPLKLTTCTFCLPALTCRYAPQHLLDGWRVCSFHLMSLDLSALSVTGFKLVSAGLSLPRVSLHRSSCLPGTSQTMTVLMQLVLPSPRCQVAQF